jgi:proline dehydrogenase
MSHHPNFSNSEIAFSGKSNADLTRAYWLFKAISSNLLVKIGPPLTTFAMAIGLPVAPIIKATIFRHFCGGESIDECNHTIQELAKYNIGTILDYSAEGAETESSFDATTKETIATIARAKGDDKISFAVFKVTGIASITLLEKMDAGASLSPAEQAAFKRVSDRMYEICKAAHGANVRIFIDAEESWIQKTIDALAFQMMAHFNKTEAIVYNTYQFYRHDRLAAMQSAHEKLKAAGLFFGIKLVRGAYMEKERARAAAKNYEDPIQINKNASDAAYDAALDYCVANLADISICAGTHNESSSMFLVKLMAQFGIAANDRRIYFSQLLGMSDNLSYNLSEAGYNVAKYVPYGPVKKVLPYLFRRAEENTAIAGQMGRELSLIVAEQSRRRG